MVARMRLVQQALAELEQEDPNKGFMSLAERVLPGTGLELAKMTMLSGVPIAGRATLPGLGALSEVDRGAGKAIEGGVQGEIYHRGFGAMEKLPKVTKFALAPRSRPP